jgi:hypothetical protein
VRANAANDIDFAAWPKMTERRVQIRLGWHRYTATPEEAIKFATELAEAADAARKGATDADQ